MMNLKLPTDVLNIIKTIEDAGYEAWCVGGSVRDMLRSHIPDDYDIASSAPCEIIENLFEKTIPTGIKHGTITVVINHKPYEITRYRIDCEYSDNRHPLSVNYTANFKEDLARRDFTINAIGFHPERKIFDPFGGMEDIERKIIRTVHNPDTRFNEDALRILRAVRFSSTLSFPIEEETLASIKRNAPKIKNISAERIMVEIKKALKGNNPAILSLIINNGGLVSFGLENIKNEELLNSLPNNYKLRFAALCFLCKAEAKEIAKALKFSNLEIKEIEEFFNIFYEKIIEISKIKRSLSNLSFDDLSDAVSALEIIYSLSLSVLKEKIKIAQKNNEPYNTSMLEISGDDLKDLGFKGKEIGTLQKNILDIVLHEPEKYKKEILKILAKDLKL